MHGVGSTLGDRASTGHQSLGKHLTTEGSLPRGARLFTSEQVEVQVLEIEQVKQFSSRRWHPTTVPDRQVRHSEFGFSSSSGDVDPGRPGRGKSHLVVQTTDGRRHLVETEVGHQQQASLVIAGRLDARIIRDELVCELVVATSDPPDRPV